MTKHRPGRKTTVTPDRIHEIISAVKAGSYLEPAAEWAGVGIRTFHRRRAAGEEHVSGMEPAHFEAIEDLVLSANFVDALGDADPADFGLDGKTALYDVALVVALQRAEREAEVRLVTQWSAAAANDWRAGAELLARRHPERWQRRETRVLEGSDQNPLRIEDARIAQKIQGDPDALDLALDLLATVASQDIDEGEDPEGESREDVEKVLAVNRGDYGA